MERFGFARRTNWSITLTFHRRVHYKENWEPLLKIVTCHLLTRFTYDEMKVHCYVLILLRSTIGERILIASFPWVYIPRFSAMPQSFMVWTPSWTDWLRGTNGLDLMWNFLTAENWYLRRAVKLLVVATRKWKLELDVRYLISYVDEHDFESPWLSGCCRMLTVGTALFWLQLFISPIRDRYTHVAQSPAQSVDLSGRILFGIGRKVLWREDP